MSGLQRHPRFAELRDEFRAHPEWFIPWTGTLFRFQTVQVLERGEADRISRMLYELESGQPW